MTLLRAAALLAVVAPAARPTPGSPMGPAQPDSALVRWARAHAFPLSPAAGGFSDSASAFFRRLVGPAKILAFGEPVHGGHEPLAFRNRLIAYAVERLGFTSVALESGLTEAMLADDFIQGHGGSIDSVVRHGFTWSFQYLPENRELLAWLLTHNARAARKVHLYGIDLTGSEDIGAFPNAARAVRAAVAALQRAAPARGEVLAARLEPMMDRFLPARYVEYSPAERSTLAGALRALHRELRAVPAGPGADARLSSARALRNAWMAIRLNDLLSRWGDGTPTGAALRDSTMAENTRWAVEQEGDRGRVILFAHDGHIKNAPTSYRGPAFSGSWKVQGEYLRAWFGPRLVTLGSVAGALGGRIDSTTGWLAGGGTTPAAPGSFAAALEGVGLPVFALDLRTGDGIPAVRTILRRPWALQGENGLSGFGPRKAFDAIVYFDRVTPTVLLH